MKNATITKVKLFLTICLGVAILTGCGYKDDAGSSSSEKSNKFKTEQIKAVSTGVSQVTVDVDGEACKVKTIQYLTKSKVIPGIQGDSFRIVKCQGLSAILP